MRTSDQSKPTPATLPFLSLLLLLPAFAFGQLERGVINDRITCAADSTQQYALFIPSAYSDTVTWPLILVFEPAARARLPLESYGHLADKFGYIMACSYNSRNGPDQVIFDAANAMFQDVLARVSIDERRITLAGFSGGARISCVIALSNQKIKNVVGCGAGFPYSHMPEQPVRFGYCGMVGTRGMNYQEMTLLDSILDAYSDNHLLQTFSGGHQWPDPQTFETAFYWLETTSMRTGTIPIRQAILEEIRRDTDKKLQAAREQDDLERQLEIVGNAVKLLDGLADTKTYKDERTRLWNSDAGRELRQKKYATRSQELALQKKYLAEYEQISLRGIDPDYPIKPQSWWAKEYAKIDQLEDTALVARLYEFLINGSWEQHYNAKRLKRYNVALAYLQVYAAGLPDEPSPYYLMAVVHAAAGEPASMYRELDHAIKKGLNDPEYLAAEAAFEPYRQEKKFQKIMNALQQQDE